MAKLLALWEKMEPFYEKVLLNWFFYVYVLVLVFVLLRFLPWALRQAYDHYTEKKRVYMQITMPREESSKDKETATEKDFREKIAIMEQLYRALHEIRELNVWNQIMVWFFGRDTVSFELHAKQQDITLFASIHPYYSEILEKQITSYYPTADVQYGKPEGLQSKEAKTKNMIKGYYLYLKQLNWYPLKTYKTIENDSLNDFTNVLSKLEENERAIVQIMFRPASAKWQKEARAFARAMFKNEKPKGGIFRKVFGIFGWFFQATVFGYEAAEKGKPPPGSGSGDSYVRMLQTDRSWRRELEKKPIK